MEWEKPKAIRRLVFLGVLLVVTRSAHGGTNALDRGRSIDHLLKTSAYAKLSSTTDPPWIMFHAAAAFGKYLFVERPDGAGVDFAAFLASTVVPEEYTLFELVGDIPYFVFGGDAAPFTHEDHFGQFLFLAGRGGLPKTTPIRRESPNAVSIAQLLTQLRLDTARCWDNSMSLSALLIYEPEVAEWTNKYAEQIRLVDLVDDVIKQDRATLPCGGTHALYAAALAYNAIAQGRLAVRESTTENLHGRLRKYLDMALREFRTKLERDGFYSLTKISHEEFVALTDTQKTAITVRALGHELDWIVEYLPASELSDVTTGNTISSLIEAIQVETGTTLVNTGDFLHALLTLKAYRAKVGPSE